MNQWLKPLQSSTDSNLVDVGRYSAGQFIAYERSASRVLSPMGVRRLRGKLRCIRSDAVGVKLGASPIQRCSVNVGTTTALPARRKTKGMRVARNRGRRGTESP